MSADQENLPLDHGNDDQDTGADSDPPGYDVGYGKPPKQHQFVKGKSGNPAGRKKGNRGLRSRLEAESNKIITVENKRTGKKQRVPKLDHMLDRLSTRAFTDVRAAAQFLTLYVQALGYEDRHPRKRGLSAQEQQVLDQLFPMEDVSPDKGAAVLEVADASGSAHKGDDSDTEDFCS